VELGVIIGRGGKNIAEAEALTTCSATRSSTTSPGATSSSATASSGLKARRWTAPVDGAVIVTRDALDAANLPLELRVNGVVKQSATTAQMYFKLPRIIAELSLGMTLEPGDIIATGTPSGVGHRRSRPSFCSPATWWKPKSEASAC